MSRLQTIYTYLVENRKHELIGWYKGYKSFHDDILEIRGKLEDGKSLSHPDTFHSTSFEEEKDPYESFLQRLIYDKDNRIASRGQSVLSWNNFQAFRKNPQFKSVIKQVIIAPSKDSYNKLEEFWESQNIGNNPVLVRRALAACATNVTTTVDTGKFNSVYNWLIQRKLISQPPLELSADWYSRNEYVVKELRKALHNIERADDFWINIFYWEMYTNLSNPFELKKQVVKYGAPGTGKTFTAKQTCELQFKVWKADLGLQTDFLFDDLVEVVQFHPSYTYEDFMEGLRPVLRNNGDSYLKLQNGIFKAFCVKAGRWEVDMLQHLPETDFAELTLKDVWNIKDRLKGKYWDYIWELNEDGSKKLIEVTPPYFIVIDEINRAELSRVLGELMLCLEYRGQKGKIKTQYSQLNDEETGMYKAGDAYYFFVPHNLYIIGTMNTIDRSIESFDFALRRRFRWEEVEPAPQILRFQNHEKWAALANNLSKLNEAISAEPLLGHDYRIGHAYLMNLPYPKNTPVREIRNSVWTDSIEPLIQEYLRGTGKEELLKTFRKAFGVS